MLAKGQAAVTEIHKRRSYSWSLTDSYPKLFANARHVHVSIAPSCGGSRNWDLKGMRPVCQVYNVNINHFFVASKLHESSLSHINLH